MSILIHNCPLQGFTPIPEAFDDDHWQRQDPGLDRPLVQSGALYWQVPQETGTPNYQEMLLLLSFLVWRAVGSPSWQDCQPSLADKMSREVLGLVDTSMK